MLRITEVYEKQVRVTREQPDGSEVVNFDKAFSTRECLINEDFIVSVQPHEFISASSKLEHSFPEGTKFCTLVVDGNSFRKSEIIIVGSFDKFCRTVGVSE